MSDLKTPYSQINIPNTNPSAVELKGESIRNIVIERQQQLDAVLLHISGLETVMDGIKILHLELVEQKDKIIQSMTFHNGLVSPLWRLPTEILSQIFHHCLPEHKYLSPASNLAPMLLTRICRQWREVAMGTPSLWCRLVVDLRDRDWEQAAVYYGSWLNRSRGYLLSLAFRGWYSSKHHNLLQPYINQISSLTIGFDEAADIPEHLFKDLPALQELVVLGGFGISDASIFGQLISRLPFTMRSLDVWQLPAFDIVHLSSFNPAWAHLTIVKITIIDPDAFLHLLRLCPNLSSLTVDIVFRRTQTLEPLTHANIQSLFIVISSFIVPLLPGLFNALTLPNLRVLQARCHDDVQWPHMQLRSLLARSRCPLESLIFSGQVSDAQQAEYIALIPSLDKVVSK
ncbi:hypothetical protein DEU56DRAFT_195002 [Suillus clintonianus]|uniref:uncharacterized protein n=1 Tax=Suillus clintonianus TaxID=1904413 RepID=UPI001B87C29C|nr:uncharacterized protein DEU56DRAFT_195002 [Suillus clintonianus]KAG2145157.1 hypothetical protein DEU56DRAFT_195002 [Suillus clintonianus]